MSTFVEALRHAFALRPAEERPLPAALERLARAAVDRGLETPALIFVESCLPIAFLGGQALAAAAPLCRTLGLGADCEEIALALEDRRTVRRLAARIEELAAAARGDGR